MLRGATGKGLEVVLGGPPRTPPHPTRPLCSNGGGTAQELWSGTEAQDSPWGAAAALSARTSQEARRTTSIFIAIGALPEFCWEAALVRVRHSLLLLPSPLPRRPL